MNKSDLEQVAIRLALAEFYCKSLSGIVSEFKKESEDNQLRNKLDVALRQVHELTFEANRIRSALPELSVKRYWWDVPFTISEPSFDDTFCFEDGIYVESDKICSVLKGIRWHIEPQTEYIDYHLLSSRMTDDNTVLFYLNKSKLLNNINSRFEKRYIYNVMSVTRFYEVISYMNPRVSPVALALNEYRHQQELILQERQKALDEAQREHDKRWDIYEMVSHESLMTNKERWLYGVMSDEQYFKENIMRDYYADDKARKLKKDFERDLSAAQERSQSIQKRSRNSYVKTKTSVAGSANIIRIMPAGEALYCNGELIALFGYNSAQPITEYDCDGSTTLTELCGEYYTKKELFTKVPDPAPLARHIALYYSDKLPKYNVLRSCPKGCSDKLWRIWAEIRFLTNENSQLNN